MIKSTIKSTIRTIAMAGGLAGLLSCSPTEYQTATPYCVTGMVVDLESESYVADVVIGMGPKYKTRLVGQVKLDSNPANGSRAGEMIYLHGFGPDEGNKVEVCIHAPLDYAVQQPHLFPKMLDFNDIYKVTTEVLP